MLKVLIVDDEPLARQQLVSYVERLPFLQLAGTALNPVAAKAILNNNPVDLILLDVQMPQMTGIEFLRTENVIQQVILITAFPEYAIEGFDLAVADYLLKPVTFERFAKACERALGNVSSIAGVNLLKQQPGYLYVKCDQRLEKIYIADIHYIEAMANYVNIFSSARKYTVYSSLKGIEAQLPESGFIRTHKSYLVARAYISSIGLQYVKIGEIDIPLSRAHRKAVIESTRCQ
ncbi:LytR/AlgR family response regulator transcription factor [Mucilaginibacter sp. KACC 22063]|uniref:LytR/AlgR family response regulator transcription factor n=1 Tax=Mucilaginibacter sp. KACC 22063 TaxID=3025666 RepID=UPI002366597A|nr:LytTR family DNA-binding domain-containing protein [Mucilaginibacter sp. KACC 22063]WDF57352.1 LytTR family DNA-binding domain-containing protein [Mucilaginibacter sp. KACC 22063]